MNQQTPAQKFQERMMKLHASYAATSNTPREPDGMWLTWAEAQELLAALFPAPQVPENKESP